MKFKLIYNYNSNTLIRIYLTNYIYIYIYIYRLYYFYHNYQDFSKNVIEAFASYNLSDTNVSPVLYDTIDSHPLSLFVMGDYQKRDDLLSHPQVESILFITKNNLTELFHPQLVKEFGLDGTCTIKLAGVIGKTLENYSIISIAASEALSDVLTFWTEENLNNFAKGEKIQKKLFRNETKEKGTDNKPWVPSLHLVALFRVPVCIPKLRGYQVKTGLVTKPNVRSSLGIAVNQ